MSIEEKNLILPALYVIKENGTINTTNLIKELEILFKPSGEDAEILRNRRDTKFSQKVRNLKSHRETNNMWQWTNYKKGIYSITNIGREYLNANISAIEYLFNNSFNSDDVQTLLNAVNNTQRKTKKVYIYRESDIVFEGKRYDNNGKRKTRSQRLREAALVHYTRSDGKILCEACGFDFEATYGKIGKGFIEMHHEHPLHQYSDEGFNSYVAIAIENMKPLCANCHRIIHRNSGCILSIAQLKTILAEQ